MRLSNSGGRLTAGLALGLALAGCAGGVPHNGSLYSTHQPVVEKVDYALDVNTGSSGLAYGEQARLAGWFEAMGVKYGDKIFLDDPTGNPATRSGVEALASRFGAVLQDVAPVTAGYVAAGTARVVITRAQASVPGCPDWSDKSDANPNNALSRGFGCATNVNIAAMIADPEDLIRGARATGDTAVMSNAKAIDAYRKQIPTGAGGIKDAGSKDN